MVDTVHLIVSLGHGYGIDMWSDIRRLGGVGSHPVNLMDVERMLRERLDALGSAARAELLHVLTLPDYDRAGRIGEFFQDPRTRDFAELLMDSEEDPRVRAVLIPMLREADR